MASVRVPRASRAAGGIRRTAAAAAAAVLTSFSLYPVYAGGAWWWAGAGAVASVAATGILTRRLRLPVLVCLAGGLAGLLLYLNLIFAAGRSLAVILPTPSSVGYLAHLAAQGVSEASRYAPPAPEQGGLMLLAAGGIGLTALLTDLIAVRLDRTALAGLPLLLLFAEPFTLSIKRGPLGTVAVFCLAVAGYLTLLATEGGERIRAWERPLPGHAPDDGVGRIDVSRTGLPHRHRTPGALSRIRPPDTRALAAAGRRVGVASVMAALFVPLFVPGLHVTRLFGSGSPGIGATGGITLGFPDPRTQISGELRSQRATPVLTYTTTASDPNYLQVYVLDDLTDRGWQLGQPSLVPGNGTPLDPPGLAYAAATPQVSTRISVSEQTGPDALGALPAPYPPVRVTAPGIVEADRGSLMLFDRGAPLPGLRYSVSSRDVAPSAAALATAPGPPKKIAAVYLSVPRSYDSLRTLARSITQPATTPYGRAAALQHWFVSGNFSYSLAAPAVTNAANLESFLRATRTGYCQQFAFAMAVLARLDGIPARVVYGFTQGTRQRNGDWLVTTHDAHAWPELYFAGYGWLRFEPTPGGAGGQGTAVAPVYATSRPQPVSPSQETGGNVTPNPAGTSDLNPGDLGAPAGDRRVPEPGGPGPSAQPIRSSGGASPWMLAGLSAAGLIILAAGLPGLARAVIRRRRWAVFPKGGFARLSNPLHGGLAQPPIPPAGGAARPPIPPSGGPLGPRREASPPLPEDEAVSRGLAEVAWRELLDDLADYRVEGPASESPRALARRVTAERRLSAEAALALRRVTEAAERARYSARPAGGATLRRDSRTVRYAIAASVSRRTRWRARLFPASVTVAGTVSAWLKKDRLTRHHVRLSLDIPDRDRRKSSAVRS